MTKRKRWPQNAEWARMDAIAEAEAGIREAEPVLRGETDAVGTMRVLASIVSRLYKIVLILTRARGEQ